jgi:uncharacterized protein (DUF1697 family)
MADRKRNTTAQGVHVGFLRGINVGGKNMVPMKALAAMFVEARCGDVETYIQSGNVLFSASEATARRTAGLVSRAISQRFGFEIAVVTRSTAELREIATHNPFLRTGADPKTLHVAFLAELPEPSKVAALDPNRSPPDEFAVVGREIYLRCPNGFGRTKLTNQFFESRLGTISTVRNWNTTLKLLALASARESTPHPTSDRGR